MDALTGEHMPADQLEDRVQRGHARADMVGHRRHVEVDALAGIALALPVERLVLAELGIEDHRQKAWPDPAAGDDMKRRRRLADLLARPAGELFANGLDHLPLPRHHLQGLGDRLAELGQFAATARARRRTGDHHALARQMPRKGRAHRLLAGERPHRLDAGRLVEDLVVLLRRQWG